MEVSIKYRKRLSCLSSQGAIKAEHAAAFENKTKQNKQKPNIQRLQYCYIYYLSDLLFICHYADYASPQHFQTF